MDPLTHLWARLNPAAARASGLLLGPEEALDFAHNRECAEREGASLLGQPALRALDRRVIDAVLTQATTYRAYQALRECLEWMRALIYHESAEGERSASDLILASRLSELSVACGPATFVERVIARSLLDAIRLLGRDAGFPHVGAAAARALPMFGDVPADPNWRQILECGGVAPPLGEREYRLVLRTAYGFEESIELLARESEAQLDLEVARIRNLVAAIGRRLPGQPSSAESVAYWLETHRIMPGTVLGNATRMTRDALDLFDESLISLDAEARGVRPEPTPAAMLSLVTEGEEYLAGGLTANPRAYCFLTESKCGGAYTLANVLYHELAHCWNMLGTSRRSLDLPAPLRVAGTLGTALLEGIATLREWEVFELFVGAEPGSLYAGIFDPLGLNRRDLCQEFEFDTRYWRLARLVRALFDFRVQSGQQDYVEFTQQMAQRTGLSEARLHGFCFSFFEKPGYAPCYALGAMRLSSLQTSFEVHGLSRRNFNSIASAMGLLPPAVWQERLAALSAQSANG
jgi:hypothetical protein